MSEIRDVFEMTPMQASMLFQSLYAPEEAAYFQQYWGRLDGPLDAAAFRAAWDAVIARHDILRGPRCFVRAGQRRLHCRPMPRGFAAECRGGST